MEAAKTGFQQGLGVLLVILLYSESWTLSSGQAIKEIPVRDYLRKKPKP